MWGLIDDTARGDLMAPRSYCPACKTKLSALNLIPLASYIALRGRCSSCGAEIPIRYPVVEAMGGAGVVLSFIAFGLTPAAIVASVFALALIALAFIDLETGYLPDAITLPLIALGLVANAFGLFTTPLDALIGAVAGYALFWAIGALYQRVRHREGLGLGDAKLLAAIGASTGWMSLPIVIFIAAIGTLAVVALSGGGAHRDREIPFGPGLCAAGFAALFLGPRLLSAL